MDDLYGKNRFNSPGTINSPFLNFDPAILQPTGGKFIIPEGQTEKRGKMEMSFFKIGSSVGVGGFLGLLNGTVTGLRETKDVSLKIKRSQITTIAAKHAATSAQTFGTIALLFSLYDTGINYARGVDDELNLCIAGAATGASFSAPHGYMRSLRGGVFGLGVIGAYLLVSNQTNWITNLIS